MRFMGKFLQRGKLHIWIACLAILLNALVPSISHALSAMHGASKVVEVCSTAGTKLLAIDQAAPDSSPIDSTLHHLEHCPFCLTHAGTFALPAATLTTPFAVMGGYDLFPSLFYHSPTPLFSWSGAHPRAPPTLS